MGASTFCTRITQVQPPAWAITECLPVMGMVKRKILSPFCVPTVLPSTDRVTSLWLE